MGIYEGPPFCDECYDRFPDWRDNPPLTEANPKFVRFAGRWICGNCFEELLKQTRETCRALSEWREEE